MFADIAAFTMLTQPFTNKGVVAPEWQPPQGTRRHYSAGYFDHGTTQAESHGTPGILDMSGFHTPCYIGHTMPKGGGFVRGEQYCSADVGGPGVFGFGRLHFPTPVE
uniref:Uncharacterized protein n=2 Tax=Hemiselmis andersenii TaxID=464988 RepID=A0A7S1E9K3_HEMAN